MPSTLYLSNSDVVLDKRKYVVDRSPHSSLPAVKNGYCFVTGSAFASFELSLSVGSATSNPSRNPSRNPLPPTSHLNPSFARMGNMVFPAEDRTPNGCSVSGRARAEEELSNSQ